MDEGTPSLLTTVARNAVAGSGRHLIGALAALAVTPYALRVLGAERFGVWAVAGAVLTVMQLLDLGIDRSLTRTIARQGRAARSSAEAATAVVTARALLAAMAFAGVALVALARRPIVDFVFAVPAALSDEAALVVAGTAVVAAINLMSLPWKSALDGLGRMDLTHGVESVQRLLSAAAVVLVLSLGWGLPGLVAKNLVTAALAAMALRHLLACRAPILAKLSGRPDTSIAAELLNHGRWIQTGNLAAAVVGPAHKAMLGHGPGMAAVAAYDLAGRFVDQAGALFASAGLAIYPAASQAGRRRMSEIYRPTAGALAALALPSFGLLIALAQPLSAAWLGTSTEQALVNEVGMAMMVLAAGWLVAILALPAFLVTQAADEAGARTTAGGLVLHVLVAVGAGAWWVGPRGMLGVATAAAVGLAAGALFVLARYAMRTGWRAALAPLTRPIPVAAALGATLVAALVAGVIAMPADGGTIEGWLARTFIATPMAAWLSLMLAATAGLLLYTVVMFATGEVAWLRSLRRGLDHEQAAPSSDVRNDPGALSAPIIPISPIIAIVPAWEAEDRIERCLAAVTPQVDEVIVVDNGSTDDTAARAAAAGARVLRLAQNEGWAAAINHGATAAVGRGATEPLQKGAGALLLLNDDCTPELGCVAALAAVLAGDPKAGAATARIVYAQIPDVLQTTGGLWRTAVGDVRTRGDGEPDDGRYADAPLVDYPSGACSLIRVAAWRDVGPMDEGLFLYYDDVEWGLRAKSAGWKTLYAPEAMAHHLGSAGTANAPDRRRYYNVRNRLHVAKNHATTAGLAVAWLDTIAALARHALRWPIPAHRKEAQATFAALVDHARGRRGRSERYG